MTLRTIKIATREIKQEKNSFCASSTKIGNTYYKVKFTKECEKTPKKRGLYDLTIDIDKCSIENGKKYVNEKTGFEGVSNPTIWVREIHNIRAYTEEELAAMNREKFAAVFAEEDGEADYEPLPY